MDVVDLKVYGFSSCAFCCFLALLNPTPLRSDSSFSVQKREIFGRLQDVLLGQLAEMPAQKSVASPAFVKRT